MSSLTIDNTKNVTAAQPTVRMVAGGQNDPKWRDALLRATETVDKFVEKFVASAMVNPLIEQMQDDPFKTDMFHGGFGEEVFSQQLNTQLSDEITASGKLSLAESMSGRYRLWLEAQSTEVLERTAKRSLDLAG